MMKQAFVLLALIGLAFSAPQPRKLFHEHFDDFQNIIEEEVGDELFSLFESYLEFDEFRATLDYLQTNDFRNIVYELESLPEFIAVVDFLENDNIDIQYFIDLLNEMVEDYRLKRNISHKSVRNPSGTSFSSFIEDTIALFPKDQLAALFDEKIANDEEFATAISNLQSDEWDEVSSALWENDIFQREVQDLYENGIDLGLVFQEIFAVFGQ